MGGGGEQAETMVPSQDAIIRHSHTLSHPIMQYSPHNIGPRYCNTSHPHCLPLLSARQMVQGGVVLLVQEFVLDRTGHLAGATSGSRVQWKLRCQGDEACWVRISLA